MYFASETSTDGVVERDFTVGAVPGVLWTPAAGAGPLVLMGHGGGTHKKAPAMTGRAQLLLAAGFSVAVLDAPGHGDRPRTADDDREIAAMQQAMATGEPVGPIVVRYNGLLAEQAVPEYRVALDALLEEVPGPVGYYGINMGTAIGVPLVAAEPRITAAVLGQFWPESLVELAKQITVPIEFDIQWDDEHIPRESALALFDAFASPEKTLHANAGKHK
ncbi:alpha/beta hydrolase [Amycolatopsis sp. FDAARGOS 1241]|uniref:alpha/beta hydrolase n=1 Tax=Amycolatopsis sp. FDAARGOS 1241 TaxID=2778070 RepID=UPI001951814C|nr:alpha/beta hydrolase [Amycolatopsis sp. FDAARGOS 1241]QRP44798.1 alpha/beta hydrolase [Amycolatopsis sp. FDAARGOS 1241]